MKKMILVCLCILLIASACAVESPNVQSGKVDYNPNPQYSPAELEQLALAHNQFALDLYRLLAKDEENLVYSPYSLFQALMMIYAGAEGETASQFEQVFHLAAKNPEAHALMNALNRMLKEKNENLPEERRTTLEIANGVWLRQDYQLLDSYLNLLSEHYAAGLRSLDFADAQKAADVINRWASENTHGKIEKIADPLMFNPNVVLALTNAVYFKGAWAQPFYEEATANESFTKADGGVVEVPTMHMLDRFYAVKTAEYQAVRLPYTSGGVVMEIISPAKGDLKDFTADLNAEKLNSLLSKLMAQSVNLSLPKFKLESPEMNMIESLQTLGLKDVFGMNADLSGMNGSRDLYLSTLVQKALINVDEAGTEAAAVTLAVVEEKGMFTPDPIQLRFDRPFLFILRDTTTGTILFMGQVMQP